MLYYIMKKVALCISGYFINKNKDDLINTSYIYDNLINKADNIDIFIHSFDIHSKELILHKYPNTKKYIIEPQINFTEKLNNDNIIFINKMLEYNPVNPWLNVLSMTYSRKQSINLAIEYAKENSFTYDLIYIIRFDLGIYVKPELLHNNHPNVCKLVFDPTLDNEYIYSAYWSQLNAGFADHWFISNTENMLIFANTYDYLLNNMFKLDSEYLKALVTNWPYSNKMDEMSNETENNDLLNKTYEYKYVFNAHLLYKYYFLTNTLYKKSRFIDYTNK
jgi:hypothetical protein